MTPRPALAARLAPALAPALAAAALLVAPAAFGQTVTTTFDNGVTNGWEGTQGGGGSSFIDATLGNPAPALRTIFNNFGIEFTNNTSPDYVRDYSAAPFTFSVDVLTQNVNFFGQDVSRDLILEFRDFDNTVQGYPYVSVWYDLGDLVDPDIGGSGQWETLSVTVADPTATDLPAGWGGYGDEDPVTFEPILPAFRTFADVLAGTDQVVLTTYRPGFFYGFTDFDVAVDNIALTIVPEPASALGLAGLAGAALLRRRR